MPGPGSGTTDNQTIKAGFAAAATTSNLTGNKKEDVSTKTATEIFMVVMEGSGSTGSMKIQPRDDVIAAENAPSGRRRRCEYAQIGAVYAAAKCSIGSLQNLTDVSSNSSPIITSWTLLVTKHYFLSESRIVQWLQCSQASLRRKLLMANEPYASDRKA
ncbi:hypothetical protein FOXB_03344 [Fusarium oxysporum f. sp. conglutinans Fo5176]|uniref:Uncharacterized protein n=1 Tax=Fusarium oxysporum (strain Fo5176) TaxID=660025 RepID=F9FAB8_FUSOF|nr:hypothetical protein FOXB_03344 [Fusarium oxysporum f. sp. conglutinans Fo5176]